MTVCIAAIASHYMDDYPDPIRMIIGASDRMYTAGTWTYEPQQSKRYDFSLSTSALLAGDAAENIALCEETHRRIIDSGTSLVREIARVYTDVFAEYRRTEAERKILAPLGLTLVDYRSESPELVARLERDLRFWQLDDAAIIIGADVEGVHIYTVEDPGWARCHDAIGFTAVGSGSDHAAAEFMRAGFEKRFSVARTLLLAYRAKKAAEVDPFVGIETDLFVLSPGQERVPGLHPELFDRVKTVHGELIEQDRLARREADQRIEAMVDEHVQKQAEVAAVEQEALSEGTEAVGSASRTEES